MNKEPSGIDMLRKMMSKEGKTEVITLLQDYTASAQAASKGIDLVMPSLEREWDNPQKQVDNLQQQLKTLLKLQKQSTVALANIAQVLCVYIHSSEFDTGVAQVMMDAGHGREAMQTIFKNKLKGH